jgi:pyruvate formate lyase activating enzyme
MKIAGLEKNSFVDYPGKIAAVIFTPLCNLDCYYCHNRRLLLNDIEKSLVSNEEVIDFLRKRKGFLEGLVITGGEPSLQVGLEDFICRVKGLGYAVKLDTNGTNPELIEELLTKGLLDYIAMDIKAPFSRYKEICGVNINLADIKKSIKILRGINTAAVSYEFRTTYVPELIDSDIMEIVEMIEGAQTYVLQQYRKPHDIEGFNDPRLLNLPHSPMYIKKTVSIIKEKVIRCDIRGI